MLLPRLQHPIRAREMLSHPQSGPHPRVAGRLRPAALQLRPARAAEVPLKVGAQVVGERDRVAPVARRRARTSVVACPCPSGCNKSTAAGS